MLARRKSSPAPPGRLAVQKLTSTARASLKRTTDCFGSCALAAWAVRSRATRSWSTPSKVFRGTSVVRFDIFSCYFLPRLTHLLTGFQTHQILPLSDAALQALSDAFWAAEPLLTPASAERRALLFAILTCNSKLLEERLALGDPLAIIFADSQTARLREAGGIPVFGGPSGRADQEGMSDEDEFEYGYDDEGDEDEEDLEDEEEEVEGDRLSEGSGADEREVEWGPGTRWGFEYGQEVLDARTSKFPLHSWPPACC